MLLVIDNYDSFTYNLVQYFWELGQDVRVFRNDEITLKKIEELRPKRLVISPGPCTPDEAGISMSAIKKFAGKIPVLGVCLGHQSMAQVFGSKIIRAKNIMHGKTSQVFHDGKKVFHNIPSPCVATRYHSLLVDPQTVPKDFEITAETAEKEIMGMRHKKWPLEGIQFHPESILTTEGKKMLKNFLESY